MISTNPISRSSERQKRLSAERSDWNIWATHENLLLPLRNRVDGEWIWITRSEAFGSCHKPRECGLMAGRSGHVTPLMKAELQGTSFNLNSALSPLRDARFAFSGRCGHGSDSFDRRPTPGEWLRGHVLYLDLGWLHFADEDLVEASTLQGAPVIPVTPPPRATAPPGARPLRRGETHRGADLWDLCLYELCMKFDCATAELEKKVTLGDAGADTRAEAVALIDWAEALLDFYAPAAVVYPQGYVLPAAVLRYAARRRGIQTVAIENTFRNDRFCWDDGAGVTLASPIPMTMFRNCPCGGGRGYFDAYRRGVHDLKSDEHRTGDRTRPPEFKGRKLLFIGQVNTDSSVLFYIAGGFHSQMAAIETVAQYVSAREDVALLLKTHPKEATGRNPLGAPYSTERYDTFRRRWSDVERIHLDSTASIGAFAAIDWADLCITINSQAGLEAAAAGKPVILCGAANYDQLRSVRRVDSPEELWAALDEPAPTVDADEASAFFKTYCETYCRPKSVAALVDLTTQARPARRVLWLRVLLFIRRLRRKLRAAAQLKPR